MDLFDFIDPALHEEDITYHKITDNWNKFIDSLPDDDRQLLLEIMRKYYFKYQKSIKAHGNSDYELNIALLMSILIGQQTQINEISMNSH